MTQDDLAEQAYQDEQAEKHYQYLSSILDQKESPPAAGPSSSMFDQKVRQELKLLIREVLGEIEHERGEQKSISEHWAVEAAERRAKREAQSRQDAKDEFFRLEDRVFDLERKGWGRP